MSPDPGVALSKTVLEHCAIPTRVHASLALPARIEPVAGLSGLFTQVRVSAHCAAQAVICIMVFGPQHVHEVQYYTLRTIKTGYMTPLAASNV